MCQSSRSDIEPSSWLETLRMHLRSSTTNAPKIAHCSAPANPASGYWLHHNVSADCAQSLVLLR